MKCSIWHQFASNHSGFFFVVGAFQTIEETHHAADTLRMLLQQIAAWRVQHSWSYRYEPTPIEQAFSQQYEVEWPMALDCLDSAMDIDAAITVVDRLMFVDNPDQTHMSIQPFEGLLRRLGATTAGFDKDSVEALVPLKGFLRHFGTTTAGFDKDSVEALVPYPATWFTITLTGVAPDITTAAELHAAWPERYRIYAGTIMRDGNRLRAERLFAKGHSRAKRRSMSRIIAMEIHASLLSGSLS